MKHDSIMMYLLLFVMGIFLFVILQRYVMTLDASTWTFLGHAEVATLVPVLPWLFLISLIAVPCYFILKEHV